MRHCLRGKDFLTLMDFRPEEVLFLIDNAAELKRRWALREPLDFLRGRTIAMIFEKPSTRTRTSFQAAIAHLGASSFFMRPGDMQLDRGEPIKDTARVIDRYCDGIIIRTFGQEVLEEFAQYMQHPVINALSDLTHPCQGLADFLTMREKKGELRGLKIAYAGDVWNVCHTLMIGASMFGCEMTIAAPEGYPPARRVQDFVDRMAPLSGANVRLIHDIKEAVAGADVVYGNTWHSMGEAEKQIEKRMRDFGPFQINEEVMAKADPQAIFMHCLPGYRGEDMTDEVIEGSQSVVWDQAENRLHTENAVLALIII